MNWLRYAGAQVATSIVLADRISALPDFAGKDIAILLWCLSPPMVAAVVEGHLFARHSGFAPSVRESWRFAVIATPLSLVLAGSMGCFALGLAPDLTGGLDRVRDHPAQDALPAVIGVWFAVVLVVNRSFLGLGARFIPTGDRVRKRGA